jgi:hypothetical protein
MMWKDEDNEEIDAAMYCTMCNRQLETIQEVVVDKEVNTTVS